MRIDRVEQGGLDAVRLSNGVVDVTVATGVGPRVIGFSFTGGPNVFAELRDAGLDIPGGGRFTFYGGHRLWAAPEEPERTYVPDDSPVQLIETATGVVATQPGHLEKLMEIGMGDGPVVEVTHHIANRSSETVELAPWAITQLPPGGTGVLPYGAIGEPAVRQPSALLVGWPYTEFADPQLHVGNGIVLVDADRKTETKIGTDLRRGWLAYVTGHEMFVKRARQVAGARYADRGASAQIYCDHRFLELETLGPLVALAPGESTRHVEEWFLHRASDSIDPQRVPELLEGG